MILRKMSRPKRDTDGKHRSTIYGAEDLDGAHMKLDQSFHERQADAGAFDASASGTGDTMKPFKNSLQLVFGNPGAGVLDPQDGAARGTYGLQLSWGDGRRAASDARTHDRGTRAGRRGDPAILSAMNDSAAQRQVQVMETA